MRRTLLAPPVTLPVRLGAPLAKLEGRAGLEVAALDPTFGPFTLQGDAHVGDPGVLVPDIELAAFGYFAVAKWLELGMRVGYTRGEWSTPNVAGVIAFPEGTGELWSFAPGVRFNLELLDEQRLVLSPIVEVALMSVPEAVFCHVDYCNGPPSAEPQYIFDHSTDNLFFIPDFALQLGTRVAKPVFVAVVTGVQSSAKNVGFDEPMNLGKDTTEAYLTGYFGLGVDLRIEWMFAGVHVYYVAEGEPKIEHGLRAALQLGYAF